MKYEKRNILIFDETILLLSLRIFMCLFFKIKNDFRNWEIYVLYH